MKNFKQKKLMLIILSLVAVAGAIITLVISQALYPDADEVPTNIIVIFGLFLLFAVIMILITIKQTRMHCTKCAAPLKGCAYEYQEIRSNFSNGHEEFTVRINATCQDCGTVKTIVKKFRISGDANKEYVVNRFCENLFRN